MSAPTGPVDVLVVGAGFAGLACAERLARRGVDFEVWEVRNRVGGRALTDYTLVPGVPLELGAQMVHGRRAVTHRWAREVGLSVRPLPVMQRSRLILDGRVGRYPWVGLPFHPVIGLRAVYEGLVRLPRELARYEGPDESLAAFLGARKVSRGARLLVELLHAHVYAVDPEEIGVRGPMAEERVADEEFGFRNFQLAGGYGELARRKADAFRDRLRLSTRVDRIEWTDRGARVSATSMRDGTSVSIVARRVVVTLPLGVFRAEVVRFDPPLPPEKQAAIRRISVGPALAVHLKLESRDLREQFGDFSMLWGGGASTFHRPRVGRDGWPDVLCAFTVGREAARRATLPDPELASATLEELRAVLPRGAKVGRVAGVAVHRWPEDGWARGAYSYLGPGTSLESRVHLAEPVAGTLYFAGEATHAGGESATVHGAIETGYRAAEEVCRGSSGRPSGVSDAVE